MKIARIVLADSHSVMLRGLQDLLGSTFDVVATASDAASLLQAVADYEPDVAIVDVSLPNDGAGVVGRIRASHPDVKVLMISIYDEETIVRKALEAGASGFVLKRSVASDLIPAIEQVLADGTYRSPGLRVRVPG